MRALDMIVGALVALFIVSIYVLTILFIDKDKGD
jgi:hypothetical protein